jgi:hypothetical protein
MRVIPEKNYADLANVHIEGDAENPFGKDSISSNSAPGSPDTRTTPEETLPISRARCVGTKPSRAFRRFRKVLSRTS